MQNILEFMGAADDDDDDAMQVDGRLPAESGFIGDIGGGASKHIYESDSEISAILKAGIKGRDDNMSLSSGLEMPNLNFGKL